MSSNNFVKLSKRLKESYKNFLIAQKWTDTMSGGKADKMKPQDFDQDQLSKGTKVELEHTDNPQLALEIALDHLSEDDKYYDKLETIHKD